MNFFRVKLIIWNDSEGPCGQMLAPGVSVLTPMQMV